MTARTDSARTLSTKKKMEQKGFERSSGCESSRIFAPAGATSRSTTTAEKHRDEEFEREVIEMRETVLELAPRGLIGYVYNPRAGERVALWSEGAARRCATSALS
jgi:hypothetical protein